MSASRFAVFANIILIALLLRHTTATNSTSATPTTSVRSTVFFSTLPTTASAPVFDSGLNGYVQRGRYWINTDATQTQLLIICCGFAGVLIICLCCCYFHQSRKTHKLKKTLFSFQPDLIQNERDKNQQGNNYGDIPYVDAQDPDSSLGHHHNGDVVAPAAHDNILEVDAPDDDEANYRKPNPNMNYNIPKEVENKLEESISVDISEDNDKVLDMFATAHDNNNNTNNNDNDIGPAAPPPPNEPIPEDILQRHRSRAATQMQQKKQNDNSRRNTYHPSPDNIKPKNNNNQLEMQPMSMPFGKQSMERVRTQSVVADNESVTPVSEELSGILIEDQHMKSDSLQNIANKRLSKSANMNGSAKALPLANKRNHNDPALALLSEEVIISKPMQKEKINMDKNNQENENAYENENEDDVFDALSSPSAKMLFGVDDNDNDDDIHDGHNIDNKKDPFSSIEAEFNALSNKMDHIDSKPKAKAKPKSEQSGNDVILGLLNDEPEPENEYENKSESNAEEIGNSAVLNMLSAEPNNEEQQPQSQPQHRGKQDADDPFASLDMSPNNLFSVSADIDGDKNKNQNKKEAQRDIEIEVVSENKKDKDSEAMGVIGGLLSANPEFGDNNNIFGGSAPTSNIVDFNKYANVADTAPIDYDKLTAISDTDQYKVVSVQETTIVDDGYGNIQSNTDKKINEHEETTELDNILQDNMVHASDDNVQVMQQDINDHDRHITRGLDALIAEVDDDDDDNNEIEQVQQNNDSDNDSDSDPFSPLNNDPFAALTTSSPLDHIINESADVNENNDNMNDNMNDNKTAEESDPFAELEVTSPLDNIINTSSNVNNVEMVDDIDDTTEQINMDPFADLNTSSPLDSIINEAEIVNEDPFAQLQVTSPLDAIMNESTNNNNADDDDDEFNQLSSPLDQNNNNEFNALTSPLDSIMNESTNMNIENNNNNNNNTDAFNALSSPLDDIMNESTDVDENIDNNNNNNNEDEFNLLSSPLDNIMTNAATAPSSVSVDEVNNNNNNNNTNSNQMGHQTIDIDNFMQQPNNNDNNNGVQMYDEEIKEDEESEDEESMGSEIIHETPRNSTVVHEALDPHIFGNQNHETSSDESDGYSNRTDPMDINQY